MAYHSRLLLLHALDHIDSLHNRPAAEFGHRSLVVGRGPGIDMDSQLVERMDCQSLVRNGHLVVHMDCSDHTRPLDCSLHIAVSRYRSAIVIQNEAIAKVH